MLLILLLASRQIANRPRGGADRLAFIVFWCSSLLLLSAAFVFSTLPVDINTARYLVGVLYAGAALGPVIARGRPRAETALVLGTCVFALSALTSMVNGANTQNANHFPSADLDRRIARVAEAHHLKYGYAGYWDAAPIMWATDFRLRVYPVLSCTQGDGVCRFYLHNVSSWYKPRRDVWSFLLVDPALSMQPRPTARLGRPANVYHVGRVEMYVYPYDLASRILGN